MWVIVCKDIDYDSVDNLYVSNVFGPYASEAEAYKVERGLSEQGYMYTGEIFKLENRA